MNVMTKMMGIGCCYIFTLYSLALTMPNSTTYLYEVACNIFVTGLYLSHVT